MKLGGAKRQLESGNTAALYIGSHSFTLCSLEHIAHRPPFNPWSKVIFTTLWKFIKKKETAQNILEIGILYGGSIKLWSDYFVNANKYELDLIHIDQIADGIKNKEIL